MAKKKKRQARVPQKKLHSPGEIWRLPGLEDMKMPDGESKPNTRPLLVLESSGRLVDPRITRVLVAPLSTSVLPDELDYVIVPGEHDDCYLTRESAVVVSCIQPVSKVHFESGDYLGHITSQGLFDVLGNLLELFEINPSDHA